MLEASCQGGPPEHPCGRGKGTTSGAARDADSDADSGADNGADGGADTETDADNGADSGADTDTDADIGADTDADTDADNGADSGADTDADSDANDIQSLRSNSRNHAALGVTPQGKGKGHTLDRKGKTKDPRGQTPRRSPSGGGWDTPESQREGKGSDTNQNVCFAFQKGTCTRG